MREWLDELEQYAIEVILDRKHGFRPALLRRLLWLLSSIYRLIVQLRIYLYRSRILKEHQLGCLVISIGNLTVGGTGKTPIVEKFARALQKGGRRVAILSRGYKSVDARKRRTWLDRLLRRGRENPPRVVSDGRRILLDSATSGDEPYMLASNLRNVAVVVDKDRVKGGSHAIRDLKADTLLLDDGLQYLHLKHRIDIVLVDRQAPFGNEHLLPAVRCGSPRRISAAQTTFSSPNATASRMPRSSVGSGNIIERPKSSNVPISRSIFGMFIGTRSFRSII